MPAVEILAVGTELLFGQLVDTNSPEIAAALAENGVDVFGMQTAGDNRARICAAIRFALERADGVVTSGGLGPTIDDLTKEAVCDALGVEPELHRPALEAMERYFAQTGRLMRENNRKQAFLPRGAAALVNPHGTAPGFVATRADGKFVASMPGVPREMRPMLQEQLLPWLREHYALDQAIYTRTIHTINLAESEIDHRIDDLFRALNNPKIAVLAHDYRCDVKIMAKAGSRERAESLIAPLEAEIGRRLHGHVYGTGDETLAGAIHAALRARSQTIGVAESCTGGAISAKLTAVAGASEVFRGGVVAYHNAVKTGVLGVAPESLERFGAVSERVAVEMAQGAARRLGATCALATTGVAGPGGGTPEKPVGLVWIAFARGASLRAVRLRLQGDRTAIQRRAAVAALGAAWSALLEPNGE